MDFPTSEAKIKRLCDTILDGLFWHQPDFPHVIRIRLTSARMLYTVARKKFINGQSQLRIATKAKNKKLSELAKIMRNCLKKSEVDTAANPEKLKLIGWAPKDKPNPPEVPSQPLNLRMTAKENQTVRLEWERPDDDSRIRNYIIERRQQSGDWQPVGVSYRTEMNLANQPVKVILEYRVKAVNIAGESMPSNTVSVVLP